MTLPEYSALEELIRQTRTCRRFHENTPVPTAVLEDLVELARLGGSARNLQPLKYLLVKDPERTDRIFPLLLWAGYLPEWPGPPAGERPNAYIVCLLDTRLARAADCDLGIASQNILLGATVRGLAGCRIASFSPHLRTVLRLPDHLEPLLVLALGRPREEVRLEDAGPGGEIRYWRDAHQVHHVPKRPRDELIVSID